MHTYKLNAFNIYLFVLTISMLSSMSYGDTKNGIQNEMYEILQIDRSQYNKVTEKHVKSLLDDVQNSGAEGRLIKVVFSESLKEQVGAAISYVFQGYFFVLDKGPNKIIKSSSSIFARDSLVQNKIKEYMED